MSRKHIGFRAKVVFIAGCWQIVLVLLTSTLPSKCLLCIATEKRSDVSANIVNFTYLHTTTSALYFTSSEYYSSDFKYLSAEAVYMKYQIFDEVIVQKP